MRTHEETLEREAKDDFSLIVHQARAVQVHVARKVFIECVCFVQLY
jgi:hypothetical protein